MTDALLYSKFHNLEPIMKSEVMDFIDFLLLKQKKENKNEIKPQFGCAKGRFTMSADFDAPLDDFKEYM